MFIAENQFRLLSKDINYLDAINYYRAFVAGVICNGKGKMVSIGGTEVNHCFDKKKINKAHFLLHRARRLPWIRPTIEKSTTVKIEVRKNRSRELYLADVGVYVPLLGKWIPQPSHFCVVVEPKKDGKKYFVTAYPISNPKFWQQKLALPDAFPIIST